MSPVKSTQWSFRPAQMPEDTFLNTFVDRDEEIKTIFSHILSQLAASKEPRNKKHLLFLSQRGMGKTSIFLAVKYKIKGEQSHLLDKLIPVFFNEQEEFNTVEGFIQRAYDIIINNSTFPPAVSHLEEWNRIYQNFRQELPDCYNNLLNIIKKENKKLVFFIENFDTVVYRILRQKGSKKTRSLNSIDLFNKLIKSNYIIFICSGLQKPETPHPYGEETFKIIDLETLPDLFTLILTRARYDNNLFLLSNKEKLKNKIKAFDYLTGGNTRLMVHLYECFIEKDVMKLELLLNDMINKSTPLFEWILERFIPMESREILRSLAAFGGNATIKELARDTFNQENSVRTLLNKLEKKQFVQKINAKRNNSDIYIMIPMIFFIWYQKCVLQKEDVIFNFFIHFIDFFFDPTEVDEYPRIRDIFGLNNKEEDYLSPYFSYVKEIIESGKYPPKSLEEVDKVKIKDIKSSNEKNVYELVRLQGNETVLLAEIHKALFLQKEGNIEESANTFRYVAQGYRILAQKTEDQDFIDKAEENIRRAIELYRSIKPDSLSLLRCLLILVEILSDTERHEELKIFAENIIHIANKYNTGDFFPYLGHAYKYLGFVENEYTKKREFYQQALNYFQQSENEINQIIIVLVNMGLTYKSEQKWESALEYYNKAFQLSKDKQYIQHFNALVRFIIDVYKSAEDFRGGLYRLKEIEKWLKKNDFKEIDYAAFNNNMAFFLSQNAEYVEAENYLNLSYKENKKNNNYDGTIHNLISFINFYNNLNKKNQANLYIKELYELCKSPELSTNLLFKTADIFLKSRQYNDAIDIYEIVSEKYQDKLTIKDKGIILMNTGLCYLGLDQYKKAEEQFNKAISILHENHDKDLINTAKINYALSLKFQGKIDESIKILERIEETRIFLDEVLKAVIHINLFISYIQKSKILYDDKNIDQSLSFFFKSLKHMEYAPPEDLIRIFFFTFIIPLLEQYKRSIYPFFREIDLYLHEYYNKKSLGEYLAVFKLILDLVHGDNFTDLIKNRSSFQRNILSLINDKLNEDAINEEVKTLEKDQKYEQAVGLLKKALENNPRNWAKLKKLSAIYEKMNNEEEFLDILQTIHEYYPEDMDNNIKLSDYYLDTLDLVKAENLLLSLKEKDKNNYQILYNLAKLKYRKKEYNEAIEYITKAISNARDKNWIEFHQLLLIKYYLLDHSEMSLKKAADLIKTIQVHHYNNAMTFTYYFLSLVYYSSVQNRKKIKATIKSILYVIKDVSINFTTDINFSNLLDILKTRINTKDFDFIYFADRLLLNKISISYFLYNFNEYLDVDITSKIENEIKEAGNEIYNKINNENITNFENILTICNSRIRLESLLFYINNNYPTFTEQKNNFLINFLNYILSKSPTSYVWLILEFCSMHIIKIKPDNQKSFIENFVNLLKNEEIDTYLKKEIEALLQTLKNMVDEKIKEYIEKEILNLSQGVR